MDLWTEASRDLDAERAALRMAHAKVAVAGLWPFLTLAQSDREFEHRLALTADRIVELVPADLIEPVVASLAEDFHSLAAKDAEGEEDAGDDDSDGKPDWLQKKINSESVRYYHHAGLGAWVAYDNEKPTPQELAASEPRSTDEQSDDPDEDGYWKDLGQRGPSTASYFHAGRKEWVRAVVAAQPEEKPEGGGNPYYFTGGPEGGPNTGQTNQFPPHPTGADPADPINGEFPMTPSAWTVPPGGEWKEQPMSFSPPTNRTTSSRIAVAVGDTDTCANCRNPVKAVKVSHGSGIDWTHTGSHGASADDDHPPFPERYSKSAVWQKLAEEGVEGRPGPNPHFFSGGPEGAGGAPSSFPSDMAQGADPDDRVNELYGASPISGGQVDDGSRVARRQATTYSGGMPDPEPDNPAPDSNKLQGTEFDSAQERERWNRAQNGQQQDSRASTTFSAGRRPQFFDPGDSRVRVVAANPFDGQASTNPFGDASGLGPGAGGNTSPGAGMTPPAPDMQGMTPQTTPPRQVPSGGGAPPPSGPDQDAGDAAAKEQSNGMPSTFGMRRHADGFSRDLPTADDPTGLGDEYREKTWEGPLTTRPRQSAEHRNVNTPQKPSSPIPTISSPGPGGEEDEQRREASRVADLLVRELVGL